MPKYRVLLFARRFSMSVTHRKSPNVKWLARADTWQAYPVSNLPPGSPGNALHANQQNGEPG
jgi:hypothetical protein